MQSIIPAVFLVAVSLTVHAASPKIDAEAALAIAKAKSTPKDAITGQTFSEAKKQAQETGKALVVRVGSLDCSKVCDAIRSNVIVHHLEDCRELGVCGKPLLRAMVYSQSGDWYYYEWEKLPTVEEIEKSVADLQNFAKKQVATKALDWEF